MAPPQRRRIRPTASAKKTPVDVPPNQQTVPKLNIRSAFLLMVGIPLFLTTSVVLYKRVYQGNEKKVQVGEYTPDGGLRMFNEAEKEERDRKSWLTRIFGTEK